MPINRHCRCLLLFLIGSKFPSFHVFSAVDPRPFPRETKAGKRARNQRAKQRRFVASIRRVDSSRRPWKFERDFERKGVRYFLADQPSNWYKFPARLLDSTAFGLSCRVFEKFFKRYHGIEEF